MSQELKKEEARVDESSLSEKAVRDLLTKEAGLKFIVSPIFELPAEYDLHALEGIGVKPEDFKKNIESFVNYLKDYVVIDLQYRSDGKDEEKRLKVEQERRDRRKALAVKFGHIAENLVLHNKLRAGRINAIHGRFSVWLLRSEMPQFKNWPYAAEIQKLYESFPSNTFRFHELSLPEKLLVVRQIEKIVAEFLRFVGASAKTEKTKQEAVSVSGD